MDFIANLTLKELLTYNNRNIFIEILKNFETMEKRILRKIYDYNIYINQLYQIMNNNIDENFLNSYPITFIDIFEQYNEINLNNTSNIFFYNHLAILYSNIKLHKASKPVTCDFSGEIISENREYLYYRPLLDNLTNKKTYVVLPTIKVSTYYEHYLPQNIFELEQLHQRLTNSYDNDYQDDIDYYSISCNLKTDGFTLKLLKK